MEKKNFEIKVPEGTEELIIREGNAPVIREKQPIDLSGVIGAPAEFLKKRKDQVVKDKAHVEYNYREMKIVLFLDATDYYAGKVTGKLVQNPELNPFKINSGNGFTIQDLKELYKKYRGFFASADDNSKAIVNLEKFRFSAQAEIENDNDQRGNKRELFNQSVKTNLDLNFTLSMPAFIGGDEKKFKVELLFDIRDKAVTVWLDSPELREIIISERKKLIDDAIEPFKKDYVVIED